MTFTSLASSSHGNAYIVDDGCTRLLLSVIDDKIIIE